MSVLIATLAKDGKMSGQINRLMDAYEWKRVYLIGENCEMPESEVLRHIAIDSNEPVGAIIQRLTNYFNKLFGEVGLNMVSGDGKLHMAVLSAIMKSGLGFRLVAYTKNGLEEI